jgi:hypothetical protein
MEFNVSLLPRAMDTETAFKTFDLPVGSSLEEVRRAYRELLRIWHPDRYQHDEALARRALEKTTQLNLAYEHLSSLASSGGQGVPPRPTNGTPPNQSGEQSARGPAGSNVWSDRTIWWVTLLLAVLALVLFRIQESYETRHRTATAIRSAEAPSQGTYTAPSNDVSAILWFEPDIVFDRKLRSSLELIELDALLRLFAPTERNPIRPWTAGANGELSIFWGTDGMDDTPFAASQALGAYRREGLVILARNGEAASTVLEQTAQPGMWSIAITGSKAGYSYLFLHPEGLHSFGSLIEDEPVPLVQYFQNSGWHARHFRCSSRPVPNGSVSIYELSSPGYLPLYLLDRWFAGSGGQSEEFVFIFSRTDAESVPCELDA